MATLDGPRWGPREGTAQQLVVLVHGLGADGHDLIDLAPHWAGAVPHAAFVAPDAPEHYELGGMGRQWFSVADRTPARMLAGVTAAAGVLGGFIDAELARLQLPATAYALMGFSQGAMTVLFTALRRAVPPRAVLAYSGSLLGADELVAPPSWPPILLVHGEADEVVPVERSRLAESVLTGLGAPVQALYCPRLGHGIDDAGLAVGSLFLQRGFATG